MYQTKSKWFDINPQQASIDQTISKVTSQVHIYRNVNTSAIFKTKHRYI